ncbi:MAG: TolC family outer membrane protein [Rhodospirillaceae bacterium]
MTINLRQLLLGSAAVVLLAQPAAAETLREAMALAYEGNPNLRAARAQLRAVDETVPIALSGWRPSLQVTGNASRNRNESEIISQGSTGGPVNQSGMTLRTQQTVNAQLSQPLFRGFRTVAGTSQARNQVMAQRARLEATEAQVLLQVATAYLDVLQYQAVVEVQRNNVQVLTRQLDATNDRFRVGEITRTDVAQSEAVLAASRASLVQAESSLQLARSAYLNVVGKVPEGLVQPMLPANLPATLEAAIAVAMEANPNFVAADYNARAAEDNVTVIQGELLPTVNLNATYQRGWNTLADRSRNESAIASAQVIVPLYQQGAEYARLRQAKHQSGQQSLLADQARLDARNTATAAWENYQSATASIESYRAAISANEIALEGVRREAEVGSRTVLDVLNAEQAYLAAQVSLIRAQRDQLVAAHQILSAVGQLTGADLMLETQIYDPAAHFDDVEYQAFGSDAAAGADKRQ